MTSKIRSPEAVARCDCPIHMPSIRSGCTSMTTRTLKKMNEPSVRSPFTTIRPPTSSTIACATSGRKDSSGTYSARCRFALTLCSNTASDRPANFLPSDPSWANDLTTWTPTMPSSATVATSAIFCWTSRRIG